MLDKVTDFILFLGQLTITAGLGEFCVHYQLSEILLSGYKYPTLTYPASRALSQLCEIPETRMISCMLKDLSERNVLLAWLG